MTAPAIELDRWLRNQLAEARSHFEASLEHGEKIAKLQDELRSLKPELEQLAYAVYIEQSADSRKKARAAVEAANKALQTAEAERAQFAEEHGVVLADANLSQARSSLDRALAILAVEPTQDARRLGTEADRLRRNVQRVAGAA